MIRTQFVLDFHPELIVDNFAGGGGASSGIELALGRCVDIAVNHDAEAIAMHTANHPQTRHYQEDVFAIDPVKATEGRPVGLAWFSPDCKHFSKAKGGKPKSKKIRGLAWVAVKWAATVAPRVIILENVEEFKTWGPLLANGNACPKRKGKTFTAFLSQLQRLGYVVDWKELRACDYGAPTIRKRLYLIARRDGQPIVWPQPTHCAPAQVKAKKLKPWRTAAECIDWSIPCKSIFDRERPLAEATMRRIARGIWKFVIRSANPFIVKVNHGGDEFRGQSMDDPLQTVTSKHGYGMAVPHITKFRTGSTGTTMDEPLHTVTAGKKENPAGNSHAMGMVMSHLTKFYGEKNKSETRGLLPSEPLHTQPTENRFGLVSATLVGAGGPEYSGKPKPVDQPMNSQTTENHGALVRAFLAKHYTGVIGSDLEEPVHTVTATDHNALVAANLVRPFGQSVGTPVDAPTGCITAGGMGKTALVTSHISKLKGTCKDGQPVDEPIHTVQAGGNHYAEVRALLIKYYGEGGQDQPLDDPMHTIPTKDRIGLVTVEGVDYAITDIGMRMLEPHELYAAQGFPKDYIKSPEVVDKRGQPKRMSKSSQVRLCGNSVCPPVAAAIVSANVPEMSAWGSREKRAA